eukprot:g851.t1
MKDADALTNLRSLITRGERWEWTDPDTNLWGPRENFSDIQKQIVKIGDFRYPLSYKTRIVSNRDNRHSLREVLMFLDFFLDKKEEKATGFLSKSIKTGVQFISQLKHKDLLNFFTGKTESSKHFSELKTDQLQASSAESETPRDCTSHSSFGISSFIHLRKLHGAGSVLSKIKGNESSLEAYSSVSNGPKSFHGIVSLHGNVLQNEKKRKDSAQVHGSRKMPRAHNTRYKDVDKKDHMSEHLGGDGGLTEFQIDTEGTAFSSTSEKEKNGNIQLKVNRISQNGSMNYMITDTVANLKASDMKRIVAVVTHGKVWEFKRWPKGWEQPANIFAKACGVCIHYDDAAPPGIVVNWNVHRISLSKVEQRRHEDSMATNKFWNCVDDFCALRKPFYLPSQWIK